MFVKMSFNPDPSKQAQEIIFSRKTKKICHLSLRFDNSIVCNPYIKSTLAYLLMLDLFLTNI